MVTEVWAGQEVWFEYPSHLHKWVKYTNINCWYTHYIPGEYDHSLVFSVLTTLRLTPGGARTPTGRSGHPFSGNNGDPGNRQVGRQTDRQTDTGELYVDIYILYLLHWYIVMVMCVT